MGEETRLLCLCSGCEPLAAESRYLGVQFASVGPWKLRIVALDCQGPLRLLGETPETATPLGSIPLLIDEAAPRHQGADANDRSLTVFFIHGGGGRAGQFRHVIHFLSQRGIRCIAPDLPGHGLSRTASGAARRDPQGAPVCPVEDTQSIIKAVFDALAGTRKDEKKASSTPHCGSPPRRAVLVGHSFGCLQVLRLYSQLSAENRETEVSGICLIGGDVARGPPGLAAWLFLYLPRLVLQLIRSLVGQVSQRLLYSGETRQKNRRLMDDEQQITSMNLLETVLEILAHLKGGEAHKEFQRAADAFRDKSHRPPVLLLYGEGDSVTPPAASAAALAAALGAGPLPASLPSPQYLRLPYTACGAEIRGSSCSNRNLSECLGGGPHVPPEEWARQGAVTAAVVGKAGHNVMLEQPLETNKVIWEFIKRQLQT
ncbi:alpha beta hydrolase family protein [Cyclospora cayetanensis]|uniref:Alpha beta hydrolase family protein n=1 Tax=Cyclospora cayetanensis TaxID=88456 RepID=A0A1D3CV22_9EIME|nr:alpha beta hydrolase family protein [Cyclospora cayetanensis]